MKDGNKFMVFSTDYAINRCTKLLYGANCLIALGVCSIGFVVADIFAFDRSYILALVIIVSCLFNYYFRDYFFRKGFIAQMQMKYLLKVKEERQLDKYKDFVDEEWRDDVDSKNADDYKAISAAIAEVSRMQMAV